MGDLFLSALARELEKTQRVLPSSCLFCVPQARSLVADAVVTDEDLFTHFLTPAGSNDVDNVHRPGAYETLNGKTVTIVGSHILTGKGFDERRKVRILLSEHREIQSQQVMILHVSRPLVGGIVLPEDPNEIDVATFRRYTAMLRAFPENELVFMHLEETIAQVKKICRQNQFANRYEATLPSILKEEWEYAVDEIAKAGSFQEEDGYGSAPAQRQLAQRRPASLAGQLLPIQQVVECYLMEKLHRYIFPRVMVSCRDDDERLSSVLWQMRHYGPADFGLRKEFQCYLLRARKELFHIEHKLTPLEMLLAFKNCIDHIHEAITKNLTRHRHTVDKYQLTTDDILDELLYVIVQAHNVAIAEAATEDTRESPHFPMVSVLKYVTDYHFINSNTSALGYTIANFQVAVEFFLMKATHAQNCRICYNIGSRRRGDTSFWDEATAEICDQMIGPSAVQTAFISNHSRWRTALDQRAQQQQGYSFSDGRDPRLFILGEWSADDDEDPESREKAAASDRVKIHDVAVPSTSTITQIGCGHRFFATVNDQGELAMWGDSSGGRLAHAPVQGDPRRVMAPRVVPALRGHHVLHVACGVFHTLVTDVNGHVFAWGQNARGQLGFLTHSLETTTVETPTHVVDLKGVYVGLVACGEYHSLGLSSDGRVFSWGCNKFSKLGRATDGLLDATQPKAIEASWLPQSINQSRRLDEDDAMPVGVVRRITAGRDHSIAVMCDGAVFTWGRGDSGQLGHGSYMDVPEPKQVLSIADDACEMKVTEASAGARFSLFLLRDGTVFITGEDPSLAQEAAVLLTPELVAVSPLDGGSDATMAIAAGEAHFVLVQDDGALFASYADESQDSEQHGEEAAQAEAPRRRLEHVRGIGRATRVRAGASHTLVLTS